MKLKSPRTVFWIRMVSWTSVGYLTPISVFASKFGLFNVATPPPDALGNQASGPNVSINGWGIVCCLILGTYIYTVVKEIASAYTGYSLIKQCYTGLANLVPLVITYFICYFLSGVIEQIMFCMLVLIVCRAIAIPLNPLPKWRYDKQGVEDYSDFLEHFTEFVKSRKKGGGE